MSESKTDNWVRDHSAEPAEDAITDVRDNDSQSGNEADGWQQYRMWISKAPAPRGRRTGVDPSLYTWKGYRTWTDQIKRDWSEN